MKIYSEISLEGFEAWSGGKKTLDTLTTEQCGELEVILEESYPDGIDETALNDILRFEYDWIADVLGFDSFEDLEHINNGDDKKYNVYKNGDFLESFDTEERADNYIENCIEDDNAEYVNNEYYIEEEWDEN